MSEYNNKMNHTRRKLLQNTVWVAPVVASVSLPQHAQATATNTTAQPIVPTDLLCEALEVVIGEDGVAQISGMVVSDVEGDLSGNTIMISIDSFESAETPANEPSPIVPVETSTLTIEDGAFAVSVPGIIVRNVYGSCTQSFNPPGYTISVAGTALECVLDSVRGTGCDGA